MKYFFQENRYDCGAACVATILRVLLQSFKSTIK
jgi:predicted double-glycine peptidase